ncbi:MAG: hypothetical protein IAC61_01715 [Firmicutes bacterium]|uniref:Uncharacterized protein n=1 Tax=Candidatus Alloenteromonas pullistercoris TaxID=2840785 RepID=A0A9D9GSX2_9FIRM|nr:hypothetical protein [Candidatus Enteromonas pullistercoris]
MESRLPPYLFGLAKSIAKHIYAQSNEKEHDIRLKKAQKAAIWAQNLKKVEA